MDVKLSSDFAMRFVESLDFFHDAILDKIEIDGEVIHITIDRPYVKKLGRYVDKNVVLVLNLVKRPVLISEFKTDKLMSGVQISLGEKPSVILETLEGDSIVFRVEISKCRLVTSIEERDLELPL